MLLISRRNLALGWAVPPSLAVTTLGALSPPRPKLDLLIILAASALGTLALYYVVAIWKREGSWRQTRRFPAPPLTEDDVAGYLVPTEDFDREQPARVFAELLDVPGPFEVTEHARRLPSDDVNATESQFGWKVHIRYRGFHFLLHRFCPSCDPLAYCLVEDPSCPDHILVEFARHFEALACDHNADLASVWLTRESPQPVKPQTLACRHEVAKHIAGLPGATIIELDSSRRDRAKEYIFVRFRGSLFALGPGGVYHKGPEDVFLEFAGHLQKLEDPTADVSEYTRRYERVRRPRTVARWLIAAAILWLLLLGVLLTVLVT